MKIKGTNGQWLEVRELVQFNIIADEWLTRYDCEAAGRKLTCAPLPFHAPDENLAELKLLTCRGAAADYMLHALANAGIDPSQATAAPWPPGFTNPSWAR